MTIDRHKPSITLTQMFNQKQYKQLNDVSTK